MQEAAPDPPPAARLGLEKILQARRRALAAAALLWTSLFLWTYHGPDLRVQLPETAPEFFRTQR